MIRRRLLQIATGIVLVLVGMWCAASLGWRLFGRHVDPIGPTWEVITVLAVCAIVVYFGVHLIFGSPPKQSGSDSWDSESTD